MWTPRVGDVKRLGLAGSGEIGQRARAWGGGLTPGEELTTVVRRSGGMKEGRVEPDKIFETRHQCRACGLQYSSWAGVIYHSTASNEYVSLPGRHRDLMYCEDCLPAKEAKPAESRRDSRTKNQDEWGRILRCPHCGGTGDIRGHKCQGCDGVGRVGLSG